MNLKLLKEVIEYLNETGAVYQYSCRYEECQEMDMKPSECVEESMYYVLDELYGEFDGFDDEMAEELKKRIEVALAGNDDHIWHPDLEIDHPGYSGGGIRIYG